MHHSSTDFGQRSTAARIVRRLMVVTLVVTWLGVPNPARGLQKEQAGAKGPPHAAGQQKHRGHHKGHAGHGSHGKSAAGTVSLDVYADRATLHLLTAERKSPAEGPRLSYRRSVDGGSTWTKPVTVGTGQPAPVVRRGADAQLAAAGDRLVAVWTAGGDTPSDRGPLASAVSDDGGRTWRVGPNPSDAGLPSDHPQTDVAADAAGTFHAVWIGGRTGEADKGLRYARSTDGGLSWSANATLDERCCECCWNAIQTLPGGRVNVLYRDRDPRDMSLLASRNGGRTWDEPVPVGAFDWAFDGCPHVGGALAGNGKSEGERDAALFAVVWTAKGGSDVGVFALASDNDGKSWGAPVQLGGPNSNRPDVAYARGRAVAVWDSSDESGTGIFSARSGDGGVTWSDPVRLSRDDAAATHARVIPTGEGFRVFWTEQRPGKPVTWMSRKLD